MTNKVSNDVSIAISEEGGKGDAVSTSLARDIAAAFGPKAEQPFSIVASVAEEVVGGLNAVTHWGWCYIRHLWVQEDRRRGGLGRRLVEGAVAQASAQDCAGLYVDTFDAGAVRFYEQAGFVVFGRIEGFPPGFARVFLQKRLR